MAGHARALARSQFGAGPDGGAARLFFHGGAVSASGAAMANAAALDSHDAHDGHALTKGHAGATVLPALLASTEHARRPVPGAEFLTTLVMGYEIAQRAGIALHATAGDYHSSGAWAAIGAAAVTARRLGLAAGPWREALGIAEYHGPRGPMMRCIDHPTMVKDGATWGAMTGVAAAMLAAQGFTGAPAALLDGDASSARWSDLGRHWTMLDMYFKPYPVCRWAQPAIQAALALRAEFHLDASQIETVTVSSFAEAVRLGAVPPVNTEQAQYSLGWPLACALVRGRVGADEIAPQALRDQAVTGLLTRLRLVVDAAASRAFPSERHATVSLRMRDGSVRERSCSTTLGDPSSPIDDMALITKARQSLTQVLAPDLVDRLIDRAWNISAEPDSLAALAPALDPV